jgi:hypothetical protein
VSEGERRCPKLAPGHVIEVDSTEGGVIVNRYMLLLRGGDDKLERMSPEVIQAYMKRWTAWMEGLAEKGIWDSGEPLGSEARKLTGPRAPVTDGPYTEAKEAISGYVILKADSMEQACEITRGCPHFEIDGVVEVRSLRTM